MELKTLILERLLSREALILAATVVVVSVCLSPVFSGCAKEKMPVEATRQLVIPAELEPEAVLPSFDGKIWYECTYEIGEETTEDYETCGKYIKGFLEMSEGKLENGFIKGYMREYGEYKLRGGGEIGIGTHPLLLIRILKYDTLEAAKKAFNVFEEADDLIIDGVKIEAVEERGAEEAFYMLQSNNFIIYVDGYTENARDVVNRIIELYSVPISKD